MAGKNSLLYDPRISRSAPQLLGQDFVVNFATYTRVYTVDVCLSTLVLQVGWGNLPPRPGFLTNAPKLLGMFLNASTFPGYILATEPPKKFPHICYCPSNFDGKQRAPQVAKNKF